METEAISRRLQTCSMQADSWQKLNHKLSSLKRKLAQILAVSNCSCHSHHERLQGIDYEACFLADTVKPWVPDINISSFAWFPCEDGSLQCSGTLKYTLSWFVIAFSRAWGPQLVFDVAFIAWSLHLFMVQMVSVVAAGPQSPRLLHGRSYTNLTQRDWCELVWHRQQSTVLAGSVATGRPHHQTGHWAVDTSTPADSTTSSSVSNTSQANHLGDLSQWYLSTTLCSWQSLRGCWSSPKWIGDNQDLNHYHRLHNWYSQPQVVTIPLYESNLLSNPRRNVFLYMYYIQ